MRLQEFVRHHKITYERLATAAGISRQAVSQILAGDVNPSKPTIDLVLAFCREVDPAATYESLFEDQG